MKTPSAVAAAIACGLALSGPATSTPTAAVVGRGNKTAAAAGPWTDWMLKCSHGSCYSVVGCTPDGSVTHNDPSCWQMCTCVGYNRTTAITAPPR